MILFSTLLSLSLAIVQNVPLPKFANQYYASFNFHVPQWSTGGYQPVSEPVEIWFDGVNQKERIEFYGGLDTNIMYKTAVGIIDGFAIYPEKNKLVCKHSYVDTLFGLSSAFPSNLDQFKFTQYTTKYGKQCEEWSFADPPPGGATNNFTFYVDRIHRLPVAYTYKGTSGTIMGFQNSPNYDWFDVEYTKYVPGPVNSSAFDIPSLCDWTTKSSSSDNFGMPPLGLEKAFNAMYPEDGKMTLDERNSRRLAFRKNLETVFKHNSDSSSSYKLHLNPKFAHLLPHELNNAAHHRGFNVKLAKKNLASAKPSQFYKPISKSIEDLPKSVDWRKSGAVPGNANILLRY